MTVSWAHEIYLVRAKGKVKAVCLCGWQGTFFPYVEQTTEEHTAHTGLIERKKKMRTGLWDG